MLVDEVQKLKSFSERKALLTAELTQLETDRTIQMAALKTQLLARLRSVSDTDTPLYLWFRYKDDLDLLLKHGSWKSKVYFEGDGRSIGDHPLRHSGWFQHRGEAVEAFESLKKVWSEAVTIGEVELGGNECTSFMEIELTLGWPQ
jgi:hypothetical protein